MGRLFTIQEDRTAAVASDSAQKKHPHPSQLKDIQALMYDGKFDAALGSLSTILEEHPGHIDTLYMKAVCHRYAGQETHALAALGDLKEAMPDFGRAYQEEGHLYRTMGQTNKALASYKIACQLNPALAASWKAQAELLRASGQSAEAQQAEAQAARVANLPKELAATSNLIHEGKLLKAEKLCRSFMQRNPKHVEGMRLLADIGTRFGIHDEAEFLLESALTFEPGNIQVRLDYIQVLRKRQKFTAALGQARALYDTEPDNPVFQSHFAIESLQAGDFDTALETFEKILKALPKDPATLTSKGHALKTIGKQGDAITSYQQAYEARPDHGEAYYALANLKTYQFTDAELTAMKEQEKAENILPASRIQLCFALGKAYEDRKDYDKSFTFYERGNALKKAQSRYDTDQMSNELALQASACTSDLFKKQAGLGHTAPDPIFIVGLPRAGSTLLEQILASHSQVDGTMELPNILSMTHRLRRLPGETGYPDNLATLSAAQLQKLGQSYIDDTRIHRQGAPYFIDKMPNNFRHIGLIHLILPNAKIIDARRAPMSCCFSGFKQLFAEGQEFTYGLDEVGRYYRDYVTLMDHWTKTLPGKILKVQYEDVVSNLESEVARILDYCDLEFEDACLNFHKTERSVRTASSEQVREPINKKGLEPWRPYEHHLGPLRAALGPLAE